MNYIDRDSEGLLTPSPNINSISPYHLSVADWGDVFIEIGFVVDSLVGRDCTLYKHTNDPTLRIRFHNKITRITVFKSEERIDYVHLLSCNSLFYVIADILKTIRGLYATNH